MQRQHGMNLHSFSEERQAAASAGIEGATATLAASDLVDAQMPLPHRQFRFGRMFQNPPLAPFRPPTPQGLIDLGLAMENSPDTGSHPNLPAGFTYLSQFIAHDISFDQTQGVPEGALTPEQIVQGRSPSLDLDSIYGMGPELDRQLFQADLIRLRVGATTPTLFGQAKTALPNDLPRDPGNASNPRQAIIGDARNDDNLAVAQTHLAFIRFHNAVADLLAKQGLFGKALYEATRVKVIQHYQWAVLHDFLPRILEAGVLAEVLKDGPRYFRLSAEDEPFVPVEFSFAAFRVGHSLIADVYEWNRVFQSPPQGFKAPAKLFDLFTFTGFSGNLQGSPTLPSNWVIDWTRFYDFSGLGLPNHPKFNRARKIDTTLTGALKRIPGFLASVPKEYRSLAVLDLMRGRAVGLPTGQDVAARLGVTALTPDQVAQGPHEKVLTDHGFQHETPLWYYLLKEAETLHAGERLGPVGSRIMAETLVGLIRASRVSILRQAGWEPELGQRKSNQFGMADLLVLANVVNPLGS